MVYDTLLYEMCEGIATVTLNRPAKLNTLNYQMVEDLSACFQLIRNDEEVRLIILTGAGEKAFAAGADVSHSTSFPRSAARISLAAGRKC